MNGFNFNARNLGCLVIAGVVVFACAVTMFLYGMLNNINRELVAQETALSAQFSSNQTVLDAHVAEVKERAGIGFVAGDELDQILRDAISGRYGEDGFQGGELAAAITEAYPEQAALGVTEIWSDLSAAIADNRDEFRNAQQIMVDRIRVYDTWRNEDFFRAFVINNILNAPTSNLRATAGDQTFFGQAAYQKMIELVLTSDTQDAFQTGDYEGVDVQSLDQTRPTEAR